MKTVVFSGYSDDIIQVTLGDYELEYECFSTEAIACTFSLESPSEGTMKVHATFDREGCWSFCRGIGIGKETFPPWPHEVSRCDHNWRALELKMELPNDAGVRPCP
jgi:hypothetical protein